MDQVREGVEGYLAETALHGLKYLQIRRDGFLFQILWVSEIQENIFLVVKNEVLS